MGGFAYNPRLRRLAGLPPLGGVPSFTNEDLDAYGAERAAPPAAAPPGPPEPDFSGLGQDDGGPSLPSIRGIFPAPSMGALDFPEAGPDKPKIAQSAATSAVGVPASGTQAAKSGLAAAGPAFFDVPGLIGAIPGAIGDAFTGAARGVGRLTGQLPPSPSIETAAAAARPQPPPPQAPVANATARTTSGAPRAATGSIEQAARSAGAPASQDEGLPPGDLRGPTPGARSYGGADLARVHETGGTGFMQPSVQDTAFLPDSVLEEAGMRRQLAELNAPPGQLTPAQQRAIAFETAKTRGVEGARGEAGIEAAGKRSAQYGAIEKARQQDLEALRKDPKYLAAPQRMRQHVEDALNGQYDAQRDSLDRAYGKITIQRKDDMGSLGLTGAY